MSNDASLVVNATAVPPQPVRSFKPLSNKQRRRYRSLIGKKLESMGIQNAAIPVESARKPITILNPKTMLPETIVIPKYTLQNLHRRMIRQLESQPKAVIDAFLKLDQSAFKKVSPSEEAGNGEV